MATKKKQPKIGADTTKVFLAKEYCDVIDGRRKLDEAVLAWANASSTNSDGKRVIRGTADELHKLFLSHTGKVYGATVEVVD